MRFWHLPFSILFSISRIFEIIYFLFFFLGKSFELYVSVCDERKRCDEIGRDKYWENPDTAIIKIDVENVNTHKPVWAPPPPPDETIELMEELDYDQFGEPILQVSASDR